MTPNVISVLGGPRVFGTRAARLDLLEEVERGLPVRAYETIAEALELTPVEEDRLLQVSLRTRARWKKRARLDVATSDRLVRLARILALAFLRWPAQVKAQVTGAESVQPGEIYELQAAFHRAKTHQDIELMMSLWDPNGTLTVQGNPTVTYTGSDQIRAFWLTSGSFRVVMAFAYPRGRA